MRLDLGVWRPPVAIAHRGSRLHWPENTMEAFAAAVGLGYHHLETDLHLTADGALVCIHDSTVDRTTNGTGPVSSMTYSQLESLDAGHNHCVDGEYPFRGRRIAIPSLAEVVLAFPDVALVVDLKRDGLALPLLEVVETHRLWDRLLVGSFVDSRIAELDHLAEGRVPISPGPSQARRWVLATRLGLRGPGAPAALQLPFSARGFRPVNHRLVEVAEACGIQVHVWTVNDRDAMGQLLDLGVSGLITDRAGLLKSVLTDRGEWVS